MNLYDQKITDLLKALETIARGHDEIAEFSVQGLRRVAQTAINKYNGYEPSERDVATANDKGGAS